MYNSKMSTVEKIAMKLADEIQGIQEYKKMIEEMPPGDPALPQLNQILQQEMAHAKYFYDELGKHMG